MRPPNERRVRVVTPGAAVLSADRFAVDSNAKSKCRCRCNQAQRRLDLLNQRVLWRAYQRAVALDESERSSASRILSDLAHLAWRDALLADGAMR